MRSICHLSLAHSEILFNISLSFYINYRKPPTYKQVIQANGSAKKKHKDEKPPDLWINHTENLEMKPVDSVNPAPDVCTNTTALIPRLVQQPLLHRTDLKIKIWKLIQQVKKRLAIVTIGVVTCLLHQFVEGHFTSVIPLWGHLLNTNTLIMWTLWHIPLGPY